MKNRSLTQQHLRRHPEKIERFEKVRIWSGEWGAWWRPDAAGYTTNRDEAGVYEAQDGLNRVLHCGPEKRITLEAV